MKVLFVFLFAALLVSCGDDASSEEQVQARFHADETDFKKDGKIVRIRSNNKPLTGVVFMKYDNGQLAYERNFKDGLLDGLSKSWYENGQLSSEGSFKKDQLNGVVRAWFRDGGLEYDRFYEKGICIRGGPQ